MVLFVPYFTCYYKTVSCSSLIYSTWLIYLINDEILTVLFINSLDVIFGQSVFSVVVEVFLC